MYHDYPDFDEAYDCPEQYLFGTDMIVAPYTAPAARKTGLARQDVWLPPGDWYQFFTGERFQGGATYACHGTLDDIPVFARAGAIIPLGPRVGWGGVDNPDELHLHIFIGGDGRIDLFEDDGESMAYRNGSFALTRFEQRVDDDRIVITISPPRGELAVVPSERTYHLHIYGFGEPEQITAMIDGRIRRLSFQKGAGFQVEPFILDNVTTAEFAIIAPSIEASR